MAQMSPSEILQLALENDTDLIERMNRLNVDSSDLVESRNDLINSLNRHSINPVPNAPVPSPANEVLGGEVPMAVVGRPVGRPARVLPSFVVPRLPSIHIVAGPASLRRRRVVNGCHHALTRGPRRGQHCNKRLHNSSDYCRNHYARYMSPEIRAEPHPAVYREEQKEDHSHLLYKSCSICNHKTEGPKVILECECEYHLNCYMMVQHEKNCFKCGDKVHKQDGDYPDCSICLEKIKTNKYKAKCNHLFHDNCINSWMRMGVGNNNDKCPLCRADL